MTEKLLHFIWQLGYFSTTDLSTVAGERITIVSRGTLNTDGGPDFSAAKIRINETILYGNIELHLRTSDWQRHQHDQDAKYGNVILHVVYQHDKDLPHAIPVLELQPRISSVLLQRYSSLLQSDSFVPCGSLVNTLSELAWLAWKERLLAERLCRKAKGILQLLEQSNGHWEEVCWWLVARNFGMSVNGEAFEAIASSLPLTTLAKHKHSIHQLEAMLLGQAGLLEGTYTDDYARLLQREYAFLRKKFSLSPVPVQLQWLRMRPVNFPTVRLAQLAALVYGSVHIFTKILEAEDVLEVKKLFAVTANDYWHYRYRFDKASAFRQKTVGTDTIENILVNTVVPLLFAYGTFRKDDHYKEKAVHWLGMLPAEKNKDVKGFGVLGVKSQSAFDTQSLLELKRNYCNEKRCLQCAVGTSILKRDTATTQTEPV